MAAGTLNIEIGGTTAGTDYDQLVVTGQATLDGTLNVRLVNGFMPNLDDRFQVLVFGSRKGDFAVEIGLDLGAGLRLDPQYDAGGLSLVTTGGNGPPSPGGAGSNGRHVPTWDQAALSLLPVELASDRLWQARAVTKSGTHTSEALDMVFRLWAERAAHVGKPWVAHPLSDLDAI